VTDPSVALAGRRRSPPVVLLAPGSGAAGSADIEIRDALFRALHASIGIAIDRVIVPPVRARILSTDAAVGVSRGA
jgi:hypothetical protein